MRSNLGHHRVKRAPGNRKPEPLTDRQRGQGATERDSDEVAGQRKRAGGNTGRQ